MHQNDEMLNSVSCLLSLQCLCSNVSFVFSVVSLQQYIFCCLCSVIVAVSCLLSSYFLCSNILLVQTISCLLSLQQYLDRCLCSCVLIVVFVGLYSVEKCWFTTGLSGFGVWKFALKRCPNQAPPPWTLNEVI